MQRRFSRFAFSEFLLALVLPGLAAMVVVGWAGAVRLASQRELVATQLVALNMALDLYHGQVGTWPSDDKTMSAASVLREFSDNPRIRRGLVELMPAGRADLMRPWGVPLRYLAATTGGARQRANNDRPIFVCAGPDRDFGDHNRAALGDNLATDDPQVVDRSPIRWVDDIDDSAATQSTVTQPASNRSPPATSTSLRPG